jgi:hypothetical protein
MGELAQGIADAEFWARSYDASSAVQDAATRLLCQFARAIKISWASGFTQLILPLQEEFRRLASLPIPGAITFKCAEGFAFYAVYPEAYMIAAAGSGLIQTAKVIGIRSIGAPLSAMVAAAIGAPAPISVRPVGPTFERRLSISEELKRGLLSQAMAQFAIVDEGPGISGSSFGAVADYLEDLGVPDKLIFFFPSHLRALGPIASQRHRKRWSRGWNLHHVCFEDLIVHASRPEHRLVTWAAEVVGTPAAPLVDVSGGKWRQYRYRHEAQWPPVNQQEERRKFLLKASGKTWLLKFIGLGPEGERKTARARVLAAAGFTPQVAGSCHGFIIERWFEDARTADSEAMNPKDMVEQVGRYLGFRAKSFPAGPDQGAPLAKLLEMARYNAGKVLGSEAERSFNYWQDDAAELTRLVQRVETDGRLQPWKWLILPDRRLLKCDAVDHHAGHDMIGCQDVAWDVAGAKVELRLTPELSTRLQRLVERETGKKLHWKLLEFVEACYLGFQLGSHAMAMRSSRDPGEITRIKRALEHYGRQLSVLLNRATTRTSCRLAPVHERTADQI